jgi:hypothetical protein
MLSLIRWLPRPYGMASIGLPPMPTSSTSSSAVLDAKNIPTRHTYPDRRWK